jgi:hypothetical protein
MKSKKFSQKNQNLSLKRRLFLRTSMLGIISSSIYIFKSKMAYAGGLIPFSFFKKPIPLTTNRALFLGGISTASAAVTNIDYATLTTSGNAANFGSLSAAKGDNSATSNATGGRAVVPGGYTTTGSSTIDYTAIATFGNTSNFGNLTQARCLTASNSNGTSNRGVFGGGSTTGMAAHDVTTVDYITISSLGNATSFGVIDTSRGGMAGLSNGVNNRGIFAGGDQGGGFSGGTYIQYITISSASNATSFGTMSGIHVYCGGFSNDTSGRGVVAGGSTNWASTAVSNLTEYFAIATTGNASTFGNLAQGRVVLTGTSNGTGNVGVFAGGTNSGFVDASLNVASIESVNITTPSNGTTFGQLTGARFGIGATT